MSGDMSTQRQHEVALTGLRADLDHLSVGVKESLEGIRKDIRCILDGMSRIGAIENKVDLFCAKVMEYRTTQQDTLRGVSERQLEHVRLETRFQAHLDDFDKHRQYETEWRRDHGHDHEKRDVAEEKRSQRWADRVWDIGKPLLIGALGMLLAQLAYTYVIQQPNSVEVLRLLKEHAHQTTAPPPYPQ